MVGLCSPAGPAGPSRIPVGFAGVDTPPLDELTAQEEISQRSRHYPSQSAKTPFKGCFELNPTTVLGPGHTATSLGANNLIQFERAVGLEVSLAWYRLLEDPLLPARGTGNLVVRETAGRLAINSVVGSFLGDSVASQWRF